MILACAERGHCAQVEPQVGNSERRAGLLDARHSVRPESRARHLQSRAAQRRHCASTPAIPPGNTIGLGHKNSLELVGLI